MKKKLLFVAVILSGSAFGQSFTAANEPAIGALQTMYLCDSSANALSATVGAGAVWDYSGIGKMPNPDKIYSFLANANTTDFPTSNKTIVIPGALTTYVESSATERNILGFEFYAGAGLGNVKVVFDGDKLNQMTYPFALNDNITDLISGNIFYSGTSSTCSGNSVSTVDGTGTLKLSPSVTKTNVTRHHHKSTINTTVLIFPVEITIDQYEYFDFTGANLPLFSFTNIKVLQNGLTVSSLNFILNTELPTAIASLDENALSAVKLYPNPAKEILYLNGLNGMEKISVQDLTGKTITSSVNGEKLDVSHLSTGVYTISIEKEGQLIQEKFIKE